MRRRSLRARDVCRQAAHGRADMKVCKITTASSYDQATAWWANCTSSGVYCLKQRTALLRVCHVAGGVAHVVGPCATMPVFRNNANPPQQLDVPARARCHRCRFCARATRASVVPLPVLAGAGRRVVRRMSGDSTGASCSVRTTTTTTRRKNSCRLHVPDQTTHNSFRAGPVCASCVISS